MSLFFYCRCWQKDLFHLISNHLKSEIILNAEHEYSRKRKYFELAEKYNIEVIPLGFGLYELKKDNVIALGVGYDKQNIVTNKICKNKYLTYKVLERKGINCFPRHQYYTFRDIQKTFKDFVEWNCPVVIKPCSGTYGGMGVTVNIKTVRDLKNAIVESFVFDSENYLMEQYIEGSHFRILVLKGNFIACYQRVPARIIGDGKSSIKKLLKTENKKRNTDKAENSLYPINVDNEVRRKLKSIDKTMDSVLGKNEEIYVKDVINLHSGGEVRNVENVSEDIKSLCKKVAQILDVYLAGFDFITTDISKPLNETRGVMNEVNSSPGIEGFYKTTNSGTSVDVADIILRDIFNI
jgi:cyanophycin synthetase